MTKKKALITGITGQDGSYLAELLLEKGYEVAGLVRRSSLQNMARINHISGQITIIQGDMTDKSSLDYALMHFQPDEIYNLAAQSNVGSSFQAPYTTMEINGIGVAKLLDAARTHRDVYHKEIKIYQASTSEMIGQENPHQFMPKSPYATAKLYAHWTCINYRETYDMFICSGILYNHESPRRGIDFVTRKITNGVAKIVAGQADYIRLGNLNSYRDWGYAKEYVEAMWRMLQQDKPGDYIIATGKSYSISHFCKIAFEVAGIRDWRDRIVIDRELYRPHEVDTLCGDYSLAKKVLGWEPTTSLEKLIEIMVEEDVYQCQKSWRTS